MVSSGHSFHLELELGTISTMFSIIAITIRLKEAVAEVINSGLSITKLI